jgi:rhamnosyltransferase
MNDLTSIIIPTCNGAKTLPSLFQALAGQELAGPVEIIVIDSASTDNSLDFAKKNGARIITIERKEFDHGGTRSLAAKAAEGDILVFLTQDAVPCDEKAVARLIAPLHDDERTAACCGRQLPHPGASLFGAHLRYFNYREESVRRCYDDRQQYGLKTIFISNSFAAYRRESLAAIGYFGQRHLFAEDALAVARLLKAGYCCRYVAEARVYHSHDYGLFQDFRRYFDVGVFHRQQNWLLDEFGGAGGEGLRYVRSELQYLIDAGRYALLPLSLLRSAMKFSGYRLGRYYTKIPSTVVSRLSMNRTWWESGRRE